MSDMYGAIYNERGLDVPGVLAHLKKSGRLDGFPGATAIKSGQEALELPCEVLVPAATENQITSQNVERIKAKLVVEGANGPCTAVASQALDARGVLVVPDILANAGGVTVSYFEWAQNIQQFRWDEDRVNTELTKTMLRAFDAVAARAKAHAIDLRTAAFVVAIERVAAATELRGL